MRFNHLNSSAFVEFLRRKVFKINKPWALEWHAWREWDEETQKKHPMGWFMTETLPTAIDRAIDRVTRPYDDLRIYIRNRFVTQTHVLKTGLARGQWHEFDTRILHGLFNEFVDFVEIEQAACSEVRGPKKTFLQWLRLSEYRNIAGGLHYFDWASKLTYGDHDGIEKDHEMFGKLTPQAESAIRMKALYDWWKVTRPARVHANQAESDELFDKLMTTYGDKWMFIHNDKVSEFTGLERYREIDKIKYEEEEQWSNEDTEYMIQLIKIRKEMWT